MQFDSLSEFFAMGGHALYVWLAYGVTVAVLLANVLMLRSARKRQLARLRWSVETDVRGRGADNENVTEPG